MKYLIQCPACGQLYKTDKKENRYITDYNDDITDHCIKCKNTITPNVIMTEDWIADMVFKIKGK
jgi:transcription elongation factor Elf1